MGDFVAHDHPFEDEIFIVFSGTLYLEMSEGTVKLEQGEMYVMPKGVVHRPYTGTGVCEVILIEPIATKHTGDINSPQTKNDQPWI